ncbi:hypothetical protein CN326_17905 [Bacillus sp. AFS018417]|uniref:nucleotidyltransferase domain-containing protein n=1 Tax=Bacillus sp. AFS018417 TaxID=2033491 RepID=UPI000BF2E4CB|nr:hypothetical protein [Bacillus sp. AFS018417]PEZ03749.1 hypothetical protein CN326_17905 [Bacillus sp. AFS018417]
MTMIQAKQLNCIVEIMKNFKHPWFIAGGWAIDLGIGVVTRTHEDIDICIFREHAEEVFTYFSDWDIYVAIPGEGRVDPCLNLEDIALPRYGLHLYKEQDFIEILLTDKENDKVLFRKNKTIWMDYKHFVHEDALGRKFIAPEWQLLFKAKEGRIKDEQDFKAYIPYMNEQQKLWLTSALKEQFPSSAWIKELI